MKKLVLIGGALAMALFFGSCTSDKKTEQVAVTQQLYPKPSVKLGISIHVLPSSRGARVEGLANAAVTLKQHGKTFTGTTDASGIVTFADLVEGNYSYFISADGYAAVNGAGFASYQGDLQINGLNGNNTATNSSVTIDGTATSDNRVQVVLTRLGASVTGNVMAQLSDAAGSQTVVVTSGTVVLRLTDGSGNTLTTLENNTYTTAIGAGGVFTFTGLPENTTFRISLIGVNRSIQGVGNNPAHERALTFDTNTGTTPAFNQRLTLGIRTANVFLQ